MSDQQATPEPTEPKPIYEPTDLTVDQITDTSMHLEWRCRSDPQAFSVEVAQQGEQPATITVGGEARSYAFKNLRPGTEYAFKACSVSPFSPPVKAKTRGSAALPCGRLPLYAKKSGTQYDLYRFDPNPASAGGGFMAPVPVPTLMPVLIPTQSIAVVRLRIAGKIYLRFYMVGTNGGLYTTVDPELKTGLVQVKPPGSNITSPIVCHGDLNRDGNDELIIQNLAYRINPNDGSFYSAGERVAGLPSSQSGFVIGRDGYSGGPDPDVFKLDYDDVFGGRTLTHFKGVWNEARQMVEFRPGDSIKLPIVVREGTAPGGWDDEVRGQLVLAGGGPDDVNKTVVLRQVDKPFPVEPAVYVGYLADYQFFTH